MFKEVFNDLKKALVKKQEIRCLKQAKNGKVRWLIEIEDPENSRSFENTLRKFLEKLKEG